MTSLLLALALCWLPNADHYRVMFAERHIVAWVPCPSDECPPCMCPVYSPFVWTQWSVPGPRFDSPPCAETPGDFCVYKHPTAVDLAGNESVQPMLLWPPPQQGGCQ